MSPETALSLSHSALLLEVEKLCQHVHDNPHSSEWRGAAKAIECRVNEMRIKFQVWEREARRPTPSLAADPDLGAIEACIDFAGNVQGNNDSTVRVARAQLARLRALPPPAAPLEALREIRDNAQFHIGASGPDAKMGAVWVRTVAERGLTGAALSPSSTAPSGDMEALGAAIRLCEASGNDGLASRLKSFRAPSEGKEKGPGGLEQALEIAIYLLDLATPDKMGGTPDLFQPEDKAEGIRGWDDWEERAKEAIGIAQAFLPAPGEKGKEE